MQRRLHFVLVIFVLLSMCACSYTQTSELYRKPDNVVTQWSSFENMNGREGLGAMENKGGKGHPFDRLPAGESKVLLDVEGSGMITRMWLTTNELTTTTLRSLKFDIYWDGEDKPAVSVPFGDFFCAAIEPKLPFENALLANPEGRSFNCFIPMPFRKSAKVVITNQTDHMVRFLFYDIDFLLGMKHPKDTLYFHAYWHREKPTTLERDFEILPQVNGNGRFLGTNVGVICNPIDTGWWGEGEVKIYVDKDTIYPTIVGTGTEDYIGTGWGQGTYDHDYHGCLVANKEQNRYLFYRYHVPDPVYFDNKCRVTIQQMGGSGKDVVLGLLDKGLNIVPVTVSWKTEFVRFLDMDEPVDLAKHDSPDNSWVNYWRRDDVCALAYFYLDKPASDLPPLAPVDQRVMPTKWDEVNSN